MSKFVSIITVTDPDTGNKCDVEIRKLENGLLIGLDGCYLHAMGDEDVIISPYDGSEVEIPTDE